VRRGEQAVEDHVEGVRRRIGEKGVHFGGRRRQAEQIEGGPANQPAAVGRRRRCQAIGFQLREDEAVDRIADGGLWIAGFCPLLRSL
jgi:hypothetical protein